MQKRDSKGRFVSSKTKAKPAAKAPKPSAPVKDSFDKVLEVPLEVFQKKDMTGSVKMRANAKVTITKTDQLHEGEPILRVKRESSSRTFYTLEKNL